MEENNKYKNNPLQQITDSPLESVIRLLIDNLRIVNDTVTDDKQVNKKALEEILLQLSKLTNEEKEKINNKITENNIVISNIFQRLVETQKIDIGKRDIDYVVAEIIIEAYKKITTKKKYEIIVESAKWIVMALLTTSVGYIFYLLLELAKKIADTGGG